MDTAVKASVGSGDVFERLISANCDPGALRPMVDPRSGKTYVSLATNELDEDGKRKRKNHLVANATTTMTKESWLMLDRAVIEAAKPNLNVWNLLRSTSSYVIPDGMAVTVLQHQTESDITDATVSMDGIRRAEEDRVEYGLENLPLPIFHKDFHFSAREIAASARQGIPLDTRNASLAGTKVAQKIEKITLGTDSSFAYGGGTVYGLTNFPKRMTKTITTPSTPAPETHRTQVIEMITQAVEAYHYGPFDLVYGIGWLSAMQARYSTYDATPLVEILRSIDRVNSVTMSEWLTGSNQYDLVLVQRDPNVARAVVGMEMVTVQWDSHGGMQKNYKVMAIMVPQFRADFNDNTGIVHGSV